MFQCVKWTDFAVLALVGLVPSGITLRGGMPEAAQPNPGHPASSAAPLPRLLSGTGLYLAGSTTRIAPENLAYSPQYPLWSDGASKRRWFRLPPGTTIDAAHPEEWQFPVGSRFWKEFSFGERVETRYLERLNDGSYRYGTYVWDAALGDAVLAPTEGVRGVREIQRGVAHDVPSDGDCRACHEGRRSPILGFNALQLSADRDPNAIHGAPLAAGEIDLPELARRGLIVHLPPELLARPPRLAAPSPSARAAAGYLFGNCAHCHNDSGPLSSLGLDFGSYERTVASVAQRESGYTVPGEEHSERASALVYRMQSRFPAAQMPPLGTKLVDRAALTLIERWLCTDLSCATAHGSTNMERK